MTAMVATLAGSAAGSAAAGATATGLSAGAMGLAAGGSIISSSAFATGAGILGTLSTGLSLASAAGSLFAGNQQAGYDLALAEQNARALELSSREEMLEARREEVRGRQEANNIMDEMIQNIAAQRVAFASGGVDTGFGTPVSVAESARNIANLQISTARGDALIRAISRRRQAYAMREEALNTRAAGRQSASISRTRGISQAVGSLAELAMRRAERG